MTTHDREQVDAPERWHLRLRRRWAGRAGLLAGAVAVFAVAGSASLGVFLVGHHQSPTAATSGVASGSPGSGHAGTGAAAPAAGASATSVVGVAVTPAGTGQAFPWPPATPVPTPASHAVGGATLTLTQNSQGNYIVGAGTTITVRLTGAGVYSWTTPSSSNGMVVRLESGSASNGSAVATFVAERSGQASIDAVEGPRCPPICGPPSRLWQVEITVL